MDFKTFLINEADPMMGGAPPMGGPGPLGADPGIGSPIGGLGGGAPAMGGGMGGMPPMGGDPMMGGAPPMGSQQQVPVDIKDADVWKVLDHILNNKPLPKEEPQKPIGSQNPPPDPMMGGGDMGMGMGGMPPMGGDPMMGGAPPMTPPQQQPALMS